ncbi:MAG: 6-phosphogluconolactonase [Microthrixaceae bacterium]
MSDRHRLVTCDDAAAAARSAAELISAALVERLALVPSASLAVSGGSSPAMMFGHLAEGALDWSRIDVVQVDERVAPPDDPARNLVELRRRLPPDVLPEHRLHAIPVGLGAEAAAAAYERTLASTLGTPVIIDVVHLGLGDDGHTASLVPRDPATRVADHDVAPTDTYKGHRRVTLTYPALDRATLLVWLVTGEAKRDALARLLDGDDSIPAGRVDPDRSVVVADAAALG